MRQVRVEAPALEKDAPKDALGSVARGICRQVDRSTRALSPFLSLSSSRPQCSVPHLRRCFFAIDFDCPFLARCARSLGDAQHETRVEASADSTRTARRRRCEPHVAPPVVAVIPLGFRRPCSVPPVRRPRLSKTLCALSPLPSGKEREI